MHKIKKEANKQSSVEGAGSDLRDRKNIQKPVKAVGNPASKDNGILIFPNLRCGIQAGQKEFILNEKVAIWVERSRGRALISIILSHFSG